MEYITFLIDFIMHLDKHLVEIFHIFGVWTYLILFVIIFCETGLVITPFLPGDSLLFVVGTLSVAPKGLKISICYILLIAAAILGDTINYHIGKFLGHKIVSLNSRFINKEGLEKTQRFYEKHGGKTIVLSRFLPIIRTFAPFVAGMGDMNYSRFISFNIIGGTSWVTIFLFGGFFFGNIPAVKNNFSIVIFAIIFISALPAIFTYLSSKFKIKSKSRG